ncbi:MAG: hypothetical protein FWF60_08495 [Oscillospiraceae bacterium]|nr:hypothetical protein [Oscillospiraceae bacterium]
MSAYRYYPAESGTYTFEILAPKSIHTYCLINVMVNGLNDWDDSDVFYGGTKTVCLEGGDECFVIAQAINRTIGSTDTFQLVVRKAVQKWWQTLPPWLQWILRWLCFGWIWMAL